MSDTKPRISIEVTADERRQMRLAAATLDMSLTAFVKHRALRMKEKPTPETIKAAADLLIEAFADCGSQVSSIEDKSAQTAVIVCQGPLAGIVLQSLKSKGIL